MWLDLIREKVYFVGFIFAGSIDISSLRISFFDWDQKHRGIEGGEERSSSDPSSFIFYLL